MDSLFYHARDEGVGRLIRAHIDNNRFKPLQGPYDAIYVFITGDAGTGKTVMQDSFSYLPNVNVVFSGSTNVAGKVLRKVFTEHQYYANHHTVYSTTFQQIYKSNPIDWAKAMKILFGGQSEEVFNVACHSASEFYTKITPALKRCCAYLYNKMRKKKNDKLITLEVYRKVRKFVKSLYPQETDPVVIHKLTVQQLLDTVPRSHIPDQLIYDTYVIDEAGRLSAGWAIIFVGLYYYVNEIYDTGMTKPVIIPVGSATQSSVINDTCEEGCQSGVEYCGHRKIPVNDYSMLSMVTNASLVYDEGVFVKHNKHNRRMKTGDPVRSAQLSIMGNCLETGDPIPEDVMNYIRTNMSVTKEQYFGQKCIHLTQTHKGCREVLAADKVEKADILRCVETLTHRGEYGPTTLKNCSAPAGAMFKSANYSSEEWVKSVYDHPLTVGSRNIYNFKVSTEDISTKKNETDEPQDKPQEVQQFSVWKNTRHFYIGRPYTTTHSSNCSLVSIIGSWEDFLCDLEDYEIFMEENPELIKEFISAIERSLCYHYQGSQSMINQILECTAEKTTIDELMHSLYDVKNILVNAIKARKNAKIRKQKAKKEPGYVREECEDGYVSPDEEDDDYEKIQKEACSKDIAHVVSGESNIKMIVPKGEIVFIQSKKYPKAQRSPLIIKVGKTISLLLYPSAIKISHPLQYYIDNDKYCTKAGYKRKSCGKAVGGDFLEDEPEFSIDDYSEIGGDCDDQGGDYPRYDASCLSPQERVVNVADDAESAHEAESIEMAKDFTVLDLYPLKHNLAITVAASQGMTINALVYGMIRKVMSAYNLIVMSTRSSSSNNLNFYFEDPKGVKITPLDKITSHTIKKLVQVSNKCSGFL